MDDLVSILLPTYNRADLLKKCLESCINQTYKNIEILVGDNHSADNTEEYMTQQAKLDSRIKYYRWEENVGAYNNTAKLLDRFSGKYFLFLNDDDWLDLNYVEECINFMSNHEGYAFVTPSVVLYKKDYSFEKKCYVPDLDYANCEHRIKKILETYWFSDIVSGFFDRKVVDKMKEMDGYYFKRRVVEDVIFMIRALAVGQAKVITSAHYNKLNTGTTRSLDNDVEDFYDKTGLTKRNFLGKCLDCLVQTILEDEVFSLSINNREEYTKDLRSYLRNVWGMNPFVKITRVLKFLAMYKEIYSM